MIEDDWLICSKLQLFIEPEIGIYVEFPIKQNMYLIASISPRTRVQLTLT